MNTLLYLGAALLLSVSNPQIADVPCVIIGSPGHEKEITYKGIDYYATFPCIPSENPAAHAHIIHRK